MKIGITYEPVALTMNGKISPTTLSCISLLKRAFEELGHEVMLIAGIEELTKLLKLHKGVLPIDFVFNAADGTEPGDREALIPSILKAYHIPYSGSDTSALCLCNDKRVTKLIAQSLNIKTPNFVYIDKGDENIEYETIIKKLNFPMIVKPNKESCSIGVYTIYEKKQLIEKIEYIKDILAYDVLCEQFIAGNEITVPLLQYGSRTKALAVLEYMVDTNSEITGVFTIEQKFYENICLRKPEIENEMLDYIKKASIDLHDAIGCHDYSRCDFKLDSAGIPYLIEINPLSDLYPDGAFGIAAEMNGLDYIDLLAHILENAKTRN